MAFKHTSAPNYETVVNIVRTWSAPERFALVQDVLATLAPEAPHIPQRQPTLARALGLLATNQPAPSDAEIATMLDERRRERYGL